MNIFGNLKIWQKLALTAAVLGAPIVLLGVLLIMEMSADIDFARKEVQGARYVQLMREMLQHLAEHRGMSNAYLNGDASFKEKIAKKKDQLDEDIKSLDTVNLQYGDTLDSTSRWQSIKTDWEDLSAVVFSLTPPESFARHTAVIQKLLGLVTHIGVTSNLVLDPEPDSYFLIDAIIARLPVLAEDLGKLRGLAAGIAARKQITEGEKINLSKLIARSHTKYY